jgi:cytochrome c553
MSRLLIAVLGLGLVVAAVAPAPSPAGDLEAGRRKAEPCAACHGPGGNSTIAGTPSLAAMPAFYTHWQLIMFRDGRRKDPQMTPVAANLSDADLADLSAYYAAQPATPRPATPAAPPADARAVADAYHCTSCHGPDLMGQNLAPRLAGQDPDYLVKRLRGYKARTTSDLDGMMTMVAQSVKDEHLEMLARYFAALAPAGEATPGAR